MIKFDNTLTYSQRSSLRLCSRLCFDYTQRVIRNNNALAAYTDSAPAAAADGARVLLGGAATPRRGDIQCTARRSFLNAGSGRQALLTY